jgi:hypothetical protein
VSRLHSTYLICTVLGDTERGNKISRRRRKNNSTFNNNLRNNSTQSSTWVYATPTQYRKRRDTASIATRSVIAKPATAKYSVSNDLRYWTPRRLALLNSGVRAETITPKTNYETGNTAVQAFSLPTKTPICLRRQKRRQVLFALNKTGKGKTRKKPKFNNFSKISCKE